MESKSFTCEMCGFKKPVKVLSKNILTKKKIENKTFCMIRRKIVNSKGPCGVYNG